MVQEYKSRKFTHIKCGNAYEAQGEWYRRLTDPIYPGDGETQMFCKSCQEAVYPQNLIWTDTCQNIGEFLNDRLNRCTPIVRLLRNLWASLALGCLLGGLVLFLCLRFIPSDYNVVFGMFLGGVCALVTPLLTQETAYRLNKIDFDSLDDELQSE